MVAAAPRLLILMVFLFVPTSLASDWKPPTEKKALDKAVKETIKEYDAISGNHDLVPVRRRRILIVRLGMLPHKKTSKALRRILQRERDVRAQINAMYAIVDVGDFKAVKAMYKYVLKQARTVLPAYLGRALSRTKDEEVMAWIAEVPLSHGNPVIRLSAIEALGKLRYKGGADALIAIYQREDNKIAGVNAVMKYESLRALGRIGGPGVKTHLLKSAVSTDWRMQLAAAEVMLDHYRDEQTFKAMRELAKAERQIIREEAAVSVGRNKVEPLFDTLILTMREGNLRCKWAAYEGMKAISGQDYALAPDAWDKWLRDKKKGKLDKDGAIAKKERMSVSTYYNFKIFSDRVLFVVDISGSMKWLEAPPQRIDIAKKELVKAIKSLDNKTLFNVMTFSSDVHVWSKKGEVPATDENVQASLEWIEKRMLPRGGTNTHLALMRSIRDNPKVDTVFFMSDGLPSGGQIELQEEILVALRNENRFRKVKFNTIALVFGKSKIEKAWKYEDPIEMGAFMTRIAEETGGSSLVIDRPFFDLKDD